MRALPGPGYVPCQHSRPTLRGGRITLSQAVSVPDNASVEWSMIACGLPGYEGLSVAQYAAMALEAARLGDLTWLEYYAAHARFHGAFDAIAESMRQQASAKKGGRK